MSLQFFVGRVGFRIEEDELNNEQKKQNANLPPIDVQKLKRKIFRLYRFNKTGRPGFTVQLIERRCRLGVVEFTASQQSNVHSRPHSPHPPFPFAVPLPGLKQKKI
ncbi:hypothetical protein T01_16131 [Trichinella spiralis]|uniref:Uncharacterized protein n=1 Tax=Trichinella spiralis TaxID=6334 RepID=A0A0V1BRJ0_TRISP|nr:hypothetical protein T01_16131 [Trichinella spiralis]